MELNRITDLIQLLSEYKEQYGNLEVKFNAFEYGGLVADGDESAKTKLSSYDGKEYLNIELK